MCSIVLASYLSPIGIQVVSAYEYITAAGNSSISIHDDCSHALTTFDNVNIPCIFFMTSDDEFLVSDASIIIKFEDDSEVGANHDHTSHFGLPLGAALVRHRGKKAVSMTLYSEYFKKGEIRVVIAKCSICMNTVRESYCKDIESSLKYAQLEKKRKRFA